MAERWSVCVESFGICKGGWLNPHLRFPNFIELNLCFGEYWDAESFDYNLLPETLEKLSLKT